MSSVTIQSCLYGLYGLFINVIGYANVSRRLRAIDLQDCALAPLCCTYFRKLSNGRRQQLWSRILKLITEAGFMTLKPGNYKFTLNPTQVRNWPDFTKEIKGLVEPYCGKYEAFIPTISREIIGVANELGVQGRFGNNVLQFVGEIMDLMEIGVRFGDAQYGQLARYMDDHYCRYGFLTI
ncbi:hypothetical protein BO85DRAFT_480891 [Aspergillus piperis CBS 112811]|uniref:Uncharacterized protein n=1 Tax=Aspergillus piperis CBS 112811 TaxID=1448313 RepID=A0A8G1QU91_9EURO|nr:hypothetical protein BO85DRAFT_480891 [Aspergillus piperis CBS 112811]RAH53687.1 hypothetical protein BO85DRAFT_480891 [Aspergillus piperis CBS 112811]